MLKNIRPILLFFFLVNSYCQPTAGGEVSVVVLPSLERVLQDDVNVKGPQKAEVFCAKGEAESFQIIVVNPTDSDVPNIDLQAGDWKYVGDKPVGTPVSQMFREHYVEVNRVSDLNWKRVTDWRQVDGCLGPGWYPDALIPFVDPYTGERITKAKYLAAGQNVAAGKSQGYWVDILVGRDVVPGIYTNEIAVFSSGKKIAGIPVNVTVWDFELPRVHKLKTFFERLRYIHTYHNLSWNDLKRQIVTKRYLLMLQDNGIYLPLDRYPEVDKETGEVRFTIDYIKALKDYSNEIHPSITWVILQHHDFTRDPVKCARYLSGWETFIKQNPWIPQPIVYWDDPKSKEDYLRILDYGKAIHSYAPDIKFFVTTRIKPEKPENPSLIGAVDIWVILWPVGNLEDIRKRQEAGDEVWSYTCLSHNGVPNWLIDFPLLNYRIPAWFNWSMGLKGIVYWQTMAWSKYEGVKVDPWVDCRTYYAQGLIWNGEGSLLYPGAAAGIDGPVASMRLKVFRDAMEDYDYFSLLAELVGQDKVTEIVSKTASTFRIYSRDPAVYLKARALIAAEIVKHKKQDIESK